MRVPTVTELGRMHLVVFPASGGTSNSNILTLRETIDDPRHQRADRQGQASSSRQVTRRSELKSPRPTSSCTRGPKTPDSANIKKT